MEENYTRSTRGQDNLATLKLSNITSQYNSVYRCEASTGVEVVKREVNVKVISEDRFYVHGYMFGAIRIKHSIGILIMIKIQSIIVFFKWGQLFFD